MFCEFSVIGNEAVPLFLLGSGLCKKLCFTLVLSPKLGPDPLLSKRTVSVCLVSVSSPLGVDGPVDDVKEDVGSWEDDPGVLVYGVRVDPDVAVGPRADVAGHLVVLHYQFSQNPFPSDAVLFWHAVVSGGVDVHLTVAGGHQPGVGHSTGTRQLRGNPDVPQTRVRDEKGSEGV